MSNVELVEEIMTAIDTMNSVEEVEEFLEELRDELLTNQEISERDGYDSLE